MFIYFLHWPTTVVIALFFYPQWSFLLRAWPRSYPIIKKLFLFGFISDSVTVFFYSIFSYVGTASFPIWLGFLFTAIELVSLYWVVDKNKRLNAMRALLIGLGQGVALLPGISRFATTFVIARWLGIKKSRAFQYSLLIQWPLITAAALKSLFNSRVAQLLNPTLWFVILGAGVVAGCMLYGVRYLLEKDLAWLFGLYMILPTGLWLMMTFL